MWLPDQTVSVSRDEAEALSRRMIDGVVHGVMTRERFRSEYGRLLWRDGAGGRWMLGPTSRAWMQWDGRSWMPGSPPDLLRRMGGAIPHPPFVDDGRPIEAFESGTPPPPVEAVPQHVPRAPAASPPVTQWSPTHVAPPEGMSTWPEPDPAQPRGPRLGASLPVRVLEVRGAWAHVECSNGWKAWVDSRRLTPR